jgi:hypothetical protein
MGGTIVGFFLAIGTCGELNDREAELMATP